MQQRWLYILILLVSLGTNVRAQNSTYSPSKSALEGMLGLTQMLNVRGTVYDSQELQGLPGAQVKLAKMDGTLVAGGVTNEKGQFLLKDVPTGTYRMNVSFIGYKAQNFNLTLPKKSGNFKVSDVLLREDATTMAETVVEGKLPEMVVVDDTVMYNADAFILPEGAMVEDLIKKLPGITIDDDGNYLWNGKTVNQFLVDGKEFFGKNKDLILKNLPANIVDKVKAYDKQSDMARITGIDDGEEKTVLDLTIKKDKKRGWFGNVEAGYGIPQDRYTGRLMVNRFLNEQKFSVVGNGNNTQGSGMDNRQSAGATMNLEYSKIELNGSLTGDFSQGKSEGHSNSQSFENKTAAYSNRQNASRNHNNNFAFQYKMEWKPDTLTNILFRPEASYSNSWSRSNNESATWNNDPYAYEWSTDPLEAATRARLVEEGIGVNHNISANHSDNNNGKVSGSLQVNRRLTGKKGRNVTLNVDGGYNHSNSESESYSQIDYYQLLAVTGEDSIYHKTQFNEAPSKNWNMSARLSYSEPLWSGAFLQMSYQYNYRFQDRDRTVSSIFDPSNAQHGVSVDNYRDMALYGTPDTAQCNYTTNTYQNHNLRLQLRINQTKYQLTIGANVQPQLNRVDYTKGWKHYDVHQNVVNASPTLNFRYKFSKQETLNLKYNGSTGQPSITQLIPDTLSNANPLNITLGNANLKPSFTHRFEASYQKSISDLQRSYAAHFNVQTTQNSTTNRTEYDETTGGRVSMPVNVSGNWRMNGTFNFNTAFAGDTRFRINTNTGVSYTNSVGFVYQSQTKETIKNNTNGTNVNQRLRLSFRTEGQLLEVSASGAFRYNHSRATASAASNLDTYTFSYGTNLTLNLPWNMSFTTDLTEQSRRGYSDQAMNTNELLWNLTISQRFLKRKQATISLRVVDLLNQQSDVNRNVSATARTDSYTDRISQYGLLTFTYRFGRFGGRH